jgi:hypothetical protein
MMTAWSSSARTDTATAQQLPPPRLAASAHQGEPAQRAYVHASDDDLEQGCRALARIHKIA